MSLTDITYQDIAPNMLVRAIWNYLGVTSTIQGVTHEQAHNAWVNVHGITLVDGLHSPQSMYMVNDPTYDTDIVQSPCEPIEYEELSPGDRIHVIYASNDTTTHYEGVVHRVTASGVFTEEGGVIIQADDIEDAIIMRLLDGTHNPAFVPIRFEDIKKGMYISAEWVAGDVSYILYGTTSELKPNGWVSAEDIPLAIEDWAHMTYEESDSRYMSDSLGGWNNISLDEVEQGDLICIVQHLEDITTVREAIVGDVSGTLIFSLQGELLFRGVGTIYRLPNYDSV